MKERRIYCIALIVIGCIMAMEVEGQSWRRRSNPFAEGDDYHFGYVSGSVGYAMLQTNLPNAMPMGNVGGAVGAGYEFRNSGLWVNVGAQMSFHRSKLILNEYDTRTEADQTPYRGFDTQGNATTFHYRVNQTDEIEWNYIDVPIMAGYYIRGFHIGAGIKVSYALSAKSKSSGNYHLSATNDGYDVTFENMPDRGYTEYQFENSEQNKMNVGVSVLGEIGYDLLSSVPTRSRVCNILKMSFYIEYGLNNHIKGLETPQPRVSTTEDARYPVISPYLNTITDAYRTVPFFTGLKLTYMIGGSRTARVGMHHGCMCYQ